MNLSLHDYYFERFTPTEIADAIYSLKNGKSLGVDQLFAEHVKNADKRVTVLLSLLFNACLIYGFLPAGLMETVIVPIIKCSNRIHYVDVAVCVIPETRQHRTL